MVGAEVPKPAKNNIQQLCNIFKNVDPNATKSRLSDVVLISIDFENISIENSSLPVEANRQAGIAILDTRSMTQQPVDQLLRTHMFTTGTPDYVVKASNRFHFGETVVAPPSMLMSCIRSCIPPNRRLVFVSHGVTNDLLVLQSLGFRFSDNVVAVLDTVHVADEVFGNWNGALNRLLRELECPHSKLHCAGNDANFTLKALLLLAVKKLGKQGKNKDMVEIMRHIGQQEIPRRLY